MLCQDCNKREAHVQITQIVNNEKTMLSLCKDCAAARGFHSPLENAPFPLAEILSGRSQGEGAAETLDFARLLARKGEAALAARLFRRAWELGAGTFPEPCDQYADLGVHSVSAAGFPAAENEEWNRVVLAWLGQGQLSIRERRRDHRTDPDAVLERWLSDAALSRFRAPGALDEMPEDLATSYRELWAEIRAVVRPTPTGNSQTGGGR